MSLHPAPLSISYAKNDTRFFVAMDSITGEENFDRGKIVIDRLLQDLSFDCNFFIPFVFLRFLLIINRNLFFFNVIVITFHVITLFFSRTLDMSSLT